MKPVEAMNAEELITAHDESIASGWARGVIETTNELLARLRAYEAAKKTLDDYQGQCGSGNYYRAQVARKILAAMSAARDAGKGAG
jgi:hypothetical protein